jgi:hypothetical protein
MIPDRLKKIIFRKLYNDLSHVEIIPFNNSIWFVDRDEKYWYFEFQKDGTLWWRYQFFSEFFILFSLVRDEFQSILAEWVEEVLNSRVIKTYKLDVDSFTRVDEVLNSRVLRTQVALHSTSVMAEGVLNCGDSAPTIGERLNHKVSQAKEGELKDESIVDTVLSSIT